MTQASRTTRATTRDLGAENLDAEEARGLKEFLKNALVHPDLRLCRLATDALARAWSRRCLFGGDDMTRLRKVAQVGDTANRLYAAALLLALGGEALEPRAASA